MSKVPELAIGQTWEGPVQVVFDNQRTITHIDRGMGGRRVRWVDRRGNTCWVTEGMFRQWAERRVYPEGVQP